MGTPILTTKAAFRAALRTGQEASRATAQRLSDRSMLT